MIPFIAILRRIWRSRETFRRLGDSARLVALAGAVVVAVGSWLPWATFSGFPGKMTLFWAGGARAYTLALAVFGLLAISPIEGRARAGEMAALGAAGIALFTTGAISNDGGGLVNVAYGAWVTDLGALAMLVGFLGMRTDDDDEVPGLREGRSWFQLVSVVAVLGLALAAVVEALKIEASSQFIAFLAMVVFLLLALARLGVVGWWRRASERFRGVTIAAGLVAAALFPFTQGGSDYWVRVGAYLGMFAAAAVGLNVVVGLAGLLDLGYIAFFGAGAYVSASLSGAPTTNVRVTLAFGLVLVVAGMMSSGVGVFIGAPTLRLRGDYLAIVTLGFGEIFRIAMNNLDGKAGPKLTNGPNGIPNIPNLKIGSFDFGDPHTVFGVQLGYFSNYFYASVVLVAVVAFVFVRLNQSRIGRAWVAIREDETAAAAMGVNTVRLKLLAFAIGAFLAGVAGSLYAHLATQTDPTSFTFNESILLLAAVVLGGMGTIGGAILGAAFLQVLPEKLRFFSETRILIFGLALVLMMRFRPEGIVANRRRQRELHDDGSGADATSAPPGAPVASA